MMNQIKCGIVIFLIVILLIFVACSPGQSEYKSCENVEYTNELEAEDIFTINEDYELLYERELIIARYLTRGHEYEINTNIESFTNISDLSSEGAEILAIRDDCGALRYLSVDIFGDMGRISYSYTFTESFIIYSVVEVIYSEPFFINPMNIPIDTINNNRLFIFNGGVYAFFDEGTYLAVQEEMREDIINTLIYLLEIVANQ